MTSIHQGLVTCYLVCSACQLMALAIVPWPREGHSEGRRFVVWILCHNGGLCLGPRPGSPKALVGMITNSDSISTTFFLVSSLSGLFFQVQGALATVEPPVKASHWKNSSTVSPCQTRSRRAGQANLSPPHMPLHLCPECSLFAECLASSFSLEFPFFF